MEILILIFEAWKDISAPHQYGLTADWIRATWVCRAWRNAALGFPSLWSSILINSPPEDGILGIQLQRAHGVVWDLHVTCRHLYSVELQEAFYLIVDHMKSIRRLEIVYEEDRQTEIVQAFVDRVGAGLTMLRLDSDECANDFEWDFKAAKLPLLRELDIVSIIPAVVGVLDQLTTLSISYWPGDDLQKSPYTPYLHNFLAACPNLVTFNTIAQPFLNTSRLADLALVTRDSNLPVTVPKLRSMMISESERDTQMALSLMRLPSLSRFRILEIGRAHV